MSKNHRACIVIPLYREEISDFEQISMDQCFKVLGAYDIYFIVPERMEAYVQANRYVTEGKASYKSFDDSFFANIPAYNRLLKYPKFYEAVLPYEFMLIYQLDAFVFQDDLMKWCDMGYDDIGAPLFEDYYDAGPASPIIGQGNGGFCLRRVQSCYEVVTSFKKLKFRKTYTDSSRSFLRNIYRYIKHQLIFIYSLFPLQPMINEDRFWAEEIPKVFSNFMVPDPAISIGFSFEVNPDVLFELNHQSLPFGCHAWWRYDLDFWKPYIRSYGYEI